MLLTKWPSLSLSIYLSLSLSQWHLGSQRVPDELFGLSPSLKSLPQAVWLLLWLTSCLCWFCRWMGRTRWAYDSSSLSCLYWPQSSQGTDILCDSITLDMMGQKWVYSCECVTQSLFLLLLRNISHMNNYEFTFAPTCMCCEMCSWPKWAQIYMELPWTSLAITTQRTG